MNLMHIESRSSKRSPGDYEFMVEIDREQGDVTGAFDELRKKSAYFQIITRNHNGKNAEGAFYLIVPKGVVITLILYLYFFS